MAGCSPAFLRISEARFILEAAMNATIGIDTLAERCIRVLVELFKKFQMDGKIDMLADSERSCS